MAIITGRSIRVKTVALGDVVRLQQFPSHLRKPPSSCYSLDSSDSATAVPVVVPPVDGSKWTDISFMLQGEDTWGERLQDSLGKGSGGRSGGFAVDSNSIIGNESSARNAVEDHLQAFSSSEREMSNKWEAQHYERLAFARYKCATTRWLFSRYNGSAWRNRLTRPIEVKIPNRKGVSKTIKALNKPVASPKDKFQEAGDARGHLDSEGAEDGFSEEALQNGERWQMDDHLPGSAVAHADDKASTAKTETGKWSSSETRTQSWEDEMYGTGRSPPNALTSTEQGTNSTHGTASLQGQDATNSEDESAPTGSDLS
ncbi:hypothetical protein CBR_g48163 [Chara braunii]|uniref:Uncharacterized protein n=1 Tax=Chara braunii TaxID=69332 RepID=A0A388M2B8_CHABU|nr:hypothetical protein CBR_g48163 [Chara braunii]|eukprot:GBG88632.1 hypothetical protein CBR_g48163 [Chara braunii]